MDVISVTKEDGVSKQLSTSQEGPFKRFFLSHFRRVKRPISSPENARSNNAAAILDGFQRNPPRIKISGVIAAQNMVPLIKSGRFEDFADTVSDKSG